MAKTAAVAASGAEVGGQVDANVRAKLKAELPALYNRLLAKAVGIIQRSGWRGRFDMSRTTAAEDLLHEVLVRAYDGRRTWNPEKVDLWGFVVGGMKSLVYGYAHSPENQTSSFDEPLHDDDGEKKWDQVKSESDNVEQVIIDKELAQEIEAEVLAAAGDDPVLLKYLEAVMDGWVKPAEIATFTGLTAEEVYQANRKLCRRVEQRRKLVT